MDMKTGGCAYILFLFLAGAMSAGSADAGQGDEAGRLAALLREMDLFYGDPAYTVALSGHSLYLRRTVGDETCKEKPFLPRDVYTRINLCLLAEVGSLDVRPFTRGETLEFVIERSFGTPSEVMRRELASELTSFAALDEVASAATYPIVTADNFCSGGAVLIALRSDFLLLKEADAVRSILESMTERACGGDAESEFARMAPDAVR